MRNIYKLLLIFSITGSLVGCLKETFPTKDIISEQLDETALPGLVVAMNANMTAYNTMQLTSEQHYDFGYPAIGFARDLMTSDIASPVPYYGQVKDWSSNTNLGADYIRTRLPWQFYYKQIYLSNDILKRVSGNQYAGIAHAYRAMAYLDLVRMYEFKDNNYTTAITTPGVTIPWVDETTTKEDNDNNPRVPVEDMYQYIISDLTNAVELLEGYNRPAKNTPNQVVAYGLLARTYLEMGSRFNNAEYFALAAVNAQKVIDMAGSSPLTQNEWTNVNTGFSSSAPSSWLWSIEITETDDVVKSGIINFVSMMSTELTSGYASAGDPKWIDKALFESIPATDWRKESWIDPNDYENSKYVFIERGLTLEQIKNPSNRYYMAPHCQLKFRPANLTSAAAAYPLMRIEEMYLILAEAKGNVSPAEGATILQNFVTANRDASYTCTASSFEDLQDAVFNQKRIELWGEGIIFFDYKRLGKGVDRGYDGTNHYDWSRFTTNGIAPWFNFCIPLWDENTNAGTSKDKNNPDPSGTIKPIM